MDAQDGYDDDGDEFVPPPSPGDRSWRHPAEMRRDLHARATRGPESPVQPTRSPAGNRRSPWAVGFVSVVGTAVLAGSLMFTAGGIGDEPNRITLKPIATLVSRSLDTEAKSTSNSTDAGMVGIEVRTTDGGRSGSGIVIGDGSHVLTTRQLVGSNEPDAKILLVDSDGRAHHATLVMQDPYTDLAVLWTEAPGLTQFSMAAAGERELDRPLTAVGSGRGAGSRSWSQSIDELVTMAPSGVGEFAADPSAAGSVPAEAAGAIVFDESGGFVGMLSVDLGPSGNDERRAVVIPAAQVEFVADQFARHGSVNHGWLGIESPSVGTSAEVASGTPIHSVVPNSPAADAGLRAGDVLIDLCDQHVTSVEDVVALMLLTAPGTPCGVAVLRAGQPWGTTAIIGARETVT